MLFQVQGLSIAECYDTEHIKFSETDGTGLNGAVEPSSPFEVLLSGVSAPYYPLFPLQEEYILSWGVVRKNPHLACVLPLYSGSWDEKTLFHLLF